MFDLYIYIYLYTKTYAGILQISQLHKKLWKTGTPYNDYILLKVKAGTQLWLRLQAAHESGPILATHNCV